MMTGILDVSADLQLPPDVVTQAVAIVAVRRAGKSNAAAVMAEAMFHAGMPWVAIDPKGDWWGLRSNAAGDRPGLPVPIFGGLRGDLPLLAGYGRLMAELVVEHNLTCIIDVSRFSKAARTTFLTDFALRLYELHQADPQPRHIYLEEADRALPQVVRADMAACVGAWSDLVRLGGAFGIGVTLISQRCAVINKDALTQVEIMIALRTTSPQDRKAIHDWMEHHAIATEIVDSLPSLLSGEAWVSSSFFLPEHGHDPILRIRFRQRTTFDSGATPKVGERRPVATLADINLGVLEARMAAVVDKASQDDPKALRRRIAELERQLAKRPQISENPSADLSTENHRLRERIVELENRPPERVEIPAFQGGDLDKLREVATSLANSLRTVTAAMDAVTAATSARLAPAPQISPGPSRRLLPAPSAERRPAPRPEPAEDVSLKAGARRMLDVLARHHPLKVTRTQLASLTQIKVTGGTFGAYYSTLRRAGLITDQDGFVVITDAGFTQAGVEPGTPSPDELREEWDRVLKAGARNMLHVLLDRYPAPISRPDLADAVGLEVTGGTFGTYLSTLRRNGLAGETSGDLRAADMFFHGGTGVRG